MSFELVDYQGKCTDCNACYPNAQAWPFFKSVCAGCWKKFLEVVR